MGNEKTKKAKINKPKKLRLSEVALFCSQLNFFLRSGITLEESLGLMITDWNGKRFKKVLLTLENAIENRNTLGKAMAVSGAFPEYAVRMTEIGELSGNLEEVMNFLALFYQREQKTMDQFRGFFFNSLTLILMMGAVVFLLIIEVLPMFDGLITSLGGEMPGIVRGFMGFGMFLSDNFVILIAVIAALAAGTWGFLKTRAGIYAFDSFKARFPFIGTVYGKLMAARFTGALSLMVSGDIEQDTVFEMAKHVLNNGYIAKKLEKCEESAYEAGSVYDAIDKAAVFPERVSKMLVFGVKAGNLAGMASKLAETYENEVDKSLNRISSAAEIVFVTLISAVVAVILVSVILPLVRIMSLIG
jgi:type IV pilus assembly protein PilC